MKPVRTPECNRTLTLRGGTAEDDLPAQLVLAFDNTIGEPQQDAKPAFITTWQPSEAEARRLEAGACVELTVYAISDPRNPSAPPTQPPLTVGVTQAVVPERELIDRGHVDRAVGHLYAQLAERAAGPDEPGGEWPSTLPEPSAFAELWTAAVNATRAPEDGGAGDPETVDPPPDVGKIPPPPYADCTAPDRVCPDPALCKQRRRCDRNPDA